MAALEFELGPQTLATLRALTDALKGLPFAAAPAEAAAKDPEEYLSATEFCRKFDIGRTTMKRRVADGLVEVSRCGGKTPRYRWAKGYGDRA